MTNYPINSNTKTTESCNLQLKDKFFSTIYADPPWSYTNNASRAAAVNHYPTMKISDLCQMPVGQLAAPDCALFMWWVPSMAREAILLCDAWGFQIKTMCAFTWAKRTKTDKKWFFGMGNYTRGNAENCLLAVRGRPKVAVRNISQLIVAPVGAHSAKPPEVRQKIEQLYPDGRRVELFARDTSPGWAAWGHGVTGEATLSAENLGGDHG